MWYTKAEMEAAEALVMLSNSRPLHTPQGVQTQTICDNRASRHLSPHNMQPTSNTRRDHNSGSNWETNISVSLNAEVTRSGPMYNSVHMDQGGRRQAQMHPSQPRLHSDMDHQILPSKPPTQEQPGSLGQANSCSIPAVDGQPARNDNTPQHQTGQAPPRQLGRKIPFQLSAPSSRRIRLEDILNPEPVSPLATKRHQRIPSAPKNSNQPLAAELSNNDENTPPQAQRYSAPRGGQGRQEPLRSASLRSELHSQYATPTATGPDATMSPLTASSDPFDGPVQRPSLARNKRPASPETFPEPPNGSKARAAVSSKPGQPRNKNTSFTIILNPSSSDIKVTKRPRIDEFPKAAASSQFASLPTPPEDSESQVTLHEGIHTPESDSESQEVDELTSDVEESKPTKGNTAEQKRENRLESRRRKDADTHKRVAEAKLLNFQAGKIYAYDKSHPLYNPATNMDDWLINHWSVWGTQDLKYCLERELYERFTDEEKRIISTRITKKNKPHRDLPKSVRMLWFANYTDLAPTPRTEAMACQRCILGGVQCHQARKPKNSKTRKSDGTAAPPSCVACECSKGGCHIAIKQKDKLTRKPKAVVDLQVYLDRLRSPTSWPAFPPLNLSALPAPFPYNPLQWLIQHELEREQAHALNV
ncbi:hypothetical protein CC85DRAFT_302315 [Cutaneotrichosporon oleaginosum]|uniref:Uncharacterized protein n=1 Tax=Cutaneotrichosporon oleaginosum TaxID=879819 RepID=A0A0J0XN02_9TREE|nr:uncharacterized protein CC85DRAFT_302315 [Cutaneotrichosporon oleaginosum]KLT42453.1 hypothetical protein CC85DRAFT_302315 [Cutaneotrichosporon oleaginosum]TXT06972.1 hypothetical protein COLE_06303 [Cutaneotrichosporon oleaginosum]